MIRIKEYVQLMYNPMAGTRNFSAKLDEFIDIFQRKGLAVRILRTNTIDEFEDFFDNRTMKGCRVIVVSGGDGSINRVVNGMMKNNIEIPLGVIPSGTANDLAKHIGMPMNLTEAMLKVAELKTQTVDIGYVNGRYFINVCAGGLFTNVSQNIDIELKNTIGKLAYYINGVRQLPKFNNMKFKIKVEDQVIEDNFFLFLLLNGSSAGGFKRLAMNAALDDGLMNFVGIKACPINYMPILLSKIINGDHFNDKYIEYFECDHLYIECVDGDLAFLESDIDGESGPLFPLTIKVLKGAIDIVSAE